MKSRVPEFPLKRLTGFILLPLLAAFAPLFILPVIGRMLGAPGWAAIATGQSIGAAASILVAYGWPIVGPSIVAAQDTNDRVRTFLDSFHMRLAIFVPVAGAAVWLATLLVPAEYREASAVMSLSLCMVGLSPSWYYVGIGKPASIALYDSAPRIAASILSVPALLLTSVAIVYPLILLVFTATGILLSLLAVSKGSLFSGPRYREIGANLRRQWPIAVSGVITTGYTGFSVALVAMASGSVTTVASFASAFRLEAMAKGGAGAIASGFQGWVGEVRHRQQAHRMVTALSFVSFCGLLGGGFLWVFLPSVVHFIFGSQISITTLVAAFAGIGFFLYSVTLSLSLHVLAPLGKVKTISVATVAAAIVGVPAVFVFTPTMGATGAMLAITIAEAMVLMIELPVSVLAIKHVAKIFPPQLKPLAG